jgi:signal peptidase I
VGALWNQWRGLLILLVCLVLVRGIVIDWNHVPSRSMAPTILPGDRILVNKLAFGLRLPLAPGPLFRWRSPRRMDLVIFDAPDSGVLMVKRVIGLPGDSISWVDGRLRINNAEAGYQTVPESLWPPSLRRDFGHSTLLRESIFSREQTIFRHRVPLQQEGNAFEQTTVPAGCYLVMGDNRDNSADYRAFGFVPESAISGRVTMVLFSLDPGRHYLPRWRFGLSI